MARDLPCAGCGKLMVRVKASLPEGQATCHECRRARPKPRTYSRPTIPCAICGRLLWDSKTTRPEGEATCRPCKVMHGVKATRIEPQPMLKQCKRCGEMFETRRPNQVYCRAECREAGRGWKSVAKAASAEERGYGKSHRIERAKWKPLVEAGGVDCCLCGYPIEPGETWHLDHTPDRSGYRGAAHASCNVKDGASRGASRTPRPRLDKTCAGCGSAFHTIYPKQSYCSAACRPKRPKGRSKGPAKRVARDCVDCGRTIQQGSRCAPCGRRYNQTNSRNAYRLRAGIPLDAPLYSRAGRSAA